VHYSRAEPFRSITAAPTVELQVLINSLNESNSWGLSRFADPNYLSQRLDVEARMRERFFEMGGVPVLAHPIYFFLGRNKRFEEHPLNIGYEVDLSNLDRNQVSFSYGDTMLSFNEENRRLAGEPYRHPLCNRLFMLDDLEDLIKEGIFAGSSALAIEAHLWMHPLDKIVKKLDR
jgi:hypothetical protein